MKEENLKFITSIKELRNKYKGKVVMLYYGDYYYYHNKQLNHETLEGALCAWAIKITRIPYANSDSVEGARIFGKDCVFFKNVSNPQKELAVDSMREQESNAQDFVRELTIFEKIIYRQIIKKYQAKHKKCKKI